MAPPVANSYTVYYRMGSLVVEHADMGWIIFFGGLAGLMVALLFIPLRFRIYTHAGTLSLRLLGLLHGSIWVQEDEPVIRVGVWFWRKEFYPFQMLGKKKAKKKGETPSAPKKKKGMKMTRKKIFRLLRTFRIKDFRMDIDTQDVILNAYLYPLGFFLGNWGIPFRVNYERRFEMNMVVQNRLWNILRAII